MRKEKEEWNLKGKNHGIWFYEGVLETLRNKLIEDFEMWLRENLEYDGDDGISYYEADSISSKDFIEYINKRFGVEM